MERFELTFTKEEIQMVYKYVKRNLILLVVRDMPIKTRTSTIIYLTRLAKNDSKYPATDSLHAKVATV